MSFKLTSQSVGAFPGGLLLDNFSGATVLLSLSKESAAYGGNLLTVSRSNGSSSTNIGFSGSNLDAVAADAFLAGGTAFCDTWYDQSGNGNNATATTTKRPQFIKDTDGKYSLVWSNGVGMEVADSASHKTAIIDAFIVCKIGATFNDGSNYQTVLASWMATSVTNAAAGCRWGMIVSEGGFGDAFETVRNAVGDPTHPSVASASAPYTLPLSNGYRTTFHVWNYNSNRISLRRNDNLLWDDVTAGGSTTGNVTYTGTGKLYIGNNATYVQGSRGSFRSVVLFGTTRADHSAISSYLQTRWGAGEFATSFATSDGFLWSPVYTYDVETSDDANGLRWSYGEGGLYADDGSRGPSFSKASNVNNGVVLTRSAVQVGDNDTVVTGAERSERDGQLGTAIHPIAAGDNFERYVDFMFEDGPTQTGSWAAWFQTHYGAFDIGDGGGASPCICACNVLNDQIQFVTARNGVETNLGSPASLVRNTWYSVRLKVFWSVAGNADTVEMWFGLHGTTLTKIANLTAGSYISTDTTHAYLKQGIYRGFGGDNAGVLAMRFANEKFSKTAGAFAALVTSPSTLPTHS